jgi:hypothetical protein
MRAKRYLHSQQSLQQSSAMLRARMAWTHVFWSWLATWGTKRFATRFTQPPLIQPTSNNARYHASTAVPSCATRLPLQCRRAPPHFHCCSIVRHHASTASPSCATPLPLQCHLEPPRFQCCAVVRHHALITASLLFCIENAMPSVPRQPLHWCVDGLRFPI